MGNIFHRNLTKSAPCRQQKCCCCCGELNRCILTMAILSTIGVLVWVIVAIMYFARDRSELEKLTDLLKGDAGKKLQNLYANESGQESAFIIMSFFSYLMFSTFAYFGLAYKEPFARWAMFYTLLLHVIVFLGFYVAVGVSGTIEFPGTKLRLENRE